MNQLFCGDNLEILREYLDKESVDLIYLDPPFNSDQLYNVLFQRKREFHGNMIQKRVASSWVLFVAS